MEYVSSDTNVWIDFCTIERLNLPFLLPYTYIMHWEAIEKELLYPADLGTKLCDAGLVGVEITIDEFYLAESWGQTYPRLSVQDRIALAIAKKRGIVLLSGDAALKKAAVKEGVTTIGTIGILDKLFNENYISLSEYTFCLKKLMKCNGGIVRLPTAELEKRLKQFLC